MIAGILGACALAWSTSAAAEEIQVVLPGIDGVGLTLELPLAGPLIRGPRGGDRLGLVLGAPGSSSDPLAVPGRLIGGLPGLDGLNTSRSALGEALLGLQPRQLRALLTESDPSVLSHVTGSLVLPLPGLGDSPAAALPGIDGLPIGVSTP